MTWGQDITATEVQKMAPNGDSEPADEQAGTRGQPRQPYHRTCEQSLGTSVHGIKAITAVSAFQLLRTRNTKPAKSKLFTLVIQRKKKAATVLAEVVQVMKQKQKRHKKWTENRSPFDITYPTPRLARSVIQAKAGRVRSQPRKGHFLIYSHSPLTLGEASDDSGYTSSLGGPNSLANQTQRIERGEGPPISERRGRKLFKRATVASGHGWTGRSERATKGEKEISRLKVKVQGEYHTSHLTGVFRCASRSFPSLPFPSLPIPYCIPLSPTIHVIRSANCRPRSHNCNAVPFGGREVVIN